MDQERYYRYRDKILHIETRISYLIEWKNEDHISPMVRLASYKAFQEVFDGLSDILAMIVKDKKIKPKDDYSNVEICFNESIINETDKSILIEGIGLRNRLVHQYNGIKDDLAYDVIYRLIDDLNNMIRRIQSWLEKSLEN